MTEHTHTHIHSHTRARAHTHTHSVMAALADKYTQLTSMLQVST